MNTYIALGTVWVVHISIEVMEAEKEGLSLGTVDATT